MSLRAQLLSPAFPAVGLTNGMLFCLAISSFFGVPWTPVASKLFYGFLFVWVAALFWNKRHSLPKIITIDTLFGLFVVVILISVLSHGIGNSVTQKYLRFLPFMAVIPYLCGRIVAPADIRAFVMIVAWAGPLILILAAIDYLANRSLVPVHSRWVFFGYNHTPLLIGSVLSTSMIALSFQFLSTVHDAKWSWTRYRTLALSALGGVSVAMVMIAARGALLGGVLVTVLMALTMGQLPFSRRFAFVSYVLVLICLAYYTLPASQAQFYSQLATVPSEISVLSRQARFPSEIAFSGAPGITSSAEPEMESSAEPEIAFTAVPVLGGESCTPLEKGINSLEIRGVLYQEAFAMFTSLPWTGVGAALFGRHSCSGMGGYPHSTIMQSFSELGIIGGMLLSALILVSVVGVAERILSMTGASESQVVRVSLAFLIFYLFTDQIYGNYFMATGSFFLIGVSASMRSNSMWSS